MARNINDIAPGFKPLVFKFGRGELNTTKRLIWDGGADGGYKGRLTTASKLIAVSSSADDAVAGGGATKITVIGQDADGLEQSEEITLTGTTPSAETTKSFKCAYRMYVSATEDLSEVTGPNHGAITIYQSGTPANILCKILATNGQTYMAYYKIPSNMFGKLISVNIYPAAGKILTVFVSICGNGQGDGKAWNGQASFDINTGGSWVMLDLSHVPRLLRPGAEIMILGVVDSTTGTCSANFEIVLEEL
jgi:hypothetical protein